MKVEIGPYTDNDEQEREIKIHIDDYDIWSIDDTLALIIHPILVRFRENLNGHPEYLPMEEWEKILDKMIYAFYHIIYENWQCKQPRDIESLKKIHADIDEGLKLFGKHFRDLWD